MTPLEKLTTNGIPFTKMMSPATIRFSILSHIFPVPLFLLLVISWVVGGLFFKGGNIAAIYGVIVSNVLNGDREILYGTYHIIEGFL